MRGLVNARPCLAREYSVLRLSPTLNRLLDCDPEHRKLCRGQCCKGSVGYGRYRPSELSRLSKRLRRNLIHKENRYLVPSVQGICAQIEDCQRNPAYKPIECWLFPMKLRNNGLLTVAARYLRFACPIARGENKVPLWKSMEYELRMVFGDDFIKRLHQEFDKT